MGPSPGTAKWRSNGVGEKKMEGKKKEIIDVRRKERDPEADSEDGDERGATDTRIRKVDSEVYTVRRDLINPLKLLSLLLFLLHGRMRYVRRWLCALEGRDKFRVMACFDRNGRSFLSFMIVQSISRALFLSYARLRSYRVIKVRSIVQVLLESIIIGIWNFHQFLSCICRLSRSLNASGIMAR